MKDTSRSLPTARSLFSSPVFYLSHGAPLTCGKFSRLMLREAKITRAT